MSAGDPILSLDDLVNLATGGGSGSPEQINWNKKALVAGAAPGTLVAGRMVSLWQYDGQPGAATANPTSSTATTNATTGALKQTTSAASTKKRLLSMAATSTQIGTLILYDRLNHSGGLDGTATGAQTTNLPTASLTRHTSGVGVEAWVEIYTQIGATSRTYTLSYTNDGGSSGQTTPANTIGNTGFREAQRVLPTSIASGDKGVKAVASLTLSASTATAGAFGITMAYPLVVLPMAMIGGGYLWSGLLTPGGPLDLGATSDACLAFAFVPNGTTAPELFGHCFFVEK